MLAVEGAVFAVDGHGHVRREVVVRELGDRSAILNVSRIAAGAEDAADLDLVVGVCGGNQRAGRVVEQCRHLDGQASLGQGLLEQRHHVVSFDAVDVEAFCPPL